MLKKEKKATAKVHTDVKQPQVFLLAQSYLDCAASPKLRWDSLLHIVLFCLMILEKKTDQTF